VVDHKDEDAWTLVLAETTDPEVRMRLLAFRVSVVTREKEDLEKRVAKLELAYTMGLGIFWAAPFIAMVAGFLWYNWARLSQPWSGTKP
jgi:hypothetical protein